MQWVCNFKDQESCVKEQNVHVSVSYSNAACFLDCTLNLRSHNASEFGTSYRAFFVRSFATKVFWLRPIVGSSRLQIFLTS